MCLVLFATKTSIYRLQKQNARDKRTTKHANTALYTIQSCCCSLSLCLCLSLSLPLSFPFVRFDRCSIHHCQTQEHKPRGSRELDGRSGHLGTHNCVSSHTSPRPWRHAILRGSTVTPKHGTQSVTDPATSSKEIQLAPAQTTCAEPALSAATVEKDLHYQPCSRRSGCLVQPLPAAAPCYVLFAPLPACLLACLLNHASSSMPPPPPLPPPCLALLLHASLPPPCLCSASATPIRLLHPSSAP